jgi:cytochrome c
MPFSTADARAQDAGARAYQFCAGCHSLDPADKQIQGPILKGVIGRKVASQPGFEFSAPMRKFAADRPVWTEELIDEFMKGPDDVVPGTAMSAPPVRSAATRKAVLDYLKAQAAR